MTGGPTSMAAMTAAQWQLPCRRRPWQLRASSLHSPPRPWAAPAPQALLLGILVDVCEGLQYLHESNVVRV